MPSRKAPNILSIQSHVTFGHVGNAAAVFTLQRLGCNVWPLHTLQYSNHPGYDSWTGRLNPADAIAELIGGLEQLGVLGDCDAVLSGYLGSSAMGEVVLDAVQRVRDRNPGALYLCDPVIGDSDSGRYVADDLPALFSGRALPAADIITPNLFELGCLTDRRIETLDETLAAARTALAAGPSVVLVTSLATAETADDEISMLAVTAKEAWRVTTPRLRFETVPNGAGDAVAALFLAAYLGRGTERKGDVVAALERAAAAIFAVLEQSQRDASRELGLIAAQEALTDPPRCFTAEAVAACAGQA